LLPCAECEFAINDRNGYRRAEQGCPDMSMAIVVVPGFLVDVSGVFRGYFFKCGPYVVINKARFIFGGRDSGGRADVEKGYCAIEYSCIGDGIGCLSGYIDNITVAFCTDLDFFGYNHLSKE